MSDQDIWTFIAVCIGIALIAAAVVAAVNFVIAIITAPWFLPVMSAVAVVGASALVVFVWSRLQR